MNRGCPVFCSCPRCFDEAPRFSGHIAGSVNCRERRDSITCHAPRFQSTSVFGLSLGPRDVGETNSKSVDETVCCEDLLSTVCGRVTLLRTHVSTFLDDTCDTISQM